MCDGPNCNCGSSGIKMKRRLISDVRSCVAAELGGKPITVPDDSGTANARLYVEENPVSARALTELGDALAFQMRYHEAVGCYEKALAVLPQNYDCHRKLAARYMSILQVDKSEKEFTWCSQRTQDILDIEYRLALCAYYRGDFETARERFIKCYPYTADNGEMLIAVIYWELLCAIKLGEDIAPVLARYSDDIECGHHVGYQVTLKLFVSGDERVVKETEGCGELAVSIYEYGLYHYYLFIKDYEKARATFDYLMTLSTYFSSFAYLGAYSEKIRNDKEAALCSFFDKSSSYAIALSGGTDSAYLLYAAVKAGAKVKAYSVKSEFQPDFETADAKSVADALGADYEVLNVSVFQSPKIIENGKRRCYYCKKTIFSAITAAAGKDGFAVVLDGTNADDNREERPGMQAVDELNVRSPLMECALTKRDVINLSKQAGLFTADKPSYSCLATRIATDETITQDKLDKVHAAETYLFSKGYKNFRVRYSNDCATLEMNIRQKEKYENDEKEIANYLSTFFSSVKTGEYRRK